MAILKEIKDNELYLYMNGNLIYKRWFNTGASKVFDKMAYDKYTLTSIRDLEYENPNELIPIKAKIKIIRTEDGGRKTGFISGYRPNHVFEYGKKGELNNTFIGDIIFEGQSTIEPGEEKEVTVRFLINQPIEKYLNKGQVWWIHEGPNLIGEAEVL
ncbi:MULTISPECIES: hypothetical protein [Flavobacterium]|uniref:Elongation factor Tu n=1 Tax=Flavobacterium capsici TaxID=3075618 RepID=A0AA96F367_9FLAO|nr:MULTISPECIES: hypothetical protein [unclassified Flavobacterium]MCK6607702.1 hypothetical protein [Flavobacterium sp.]WNM20385.1 hypothetical protein RN608_06810 [Flavobacterium sp. PMR2A8]WNM21775.1 hypothetical protein RN605_00110 [Flavobacterium sp. PMTSA4]